MLFKSLPILILLLISSAHFCQGNDAPSEAVVTPEIFTDRSDITEWIIGSGGFVDPRQLVRQAYPDDPSSGCGVFATEKIESGELLLTVPWHIVMKGEPYTHVHDGPKQCVGEMECKAEYEIVESVSEDEESVSKEDEESVSKEDEDLDSTSDEELDSEYEDSQEFDHPDDDDFCTTLNTLTRELAQGEVSHFAPYIRYLNIQPMEQIPEFWSKGGRSLLTHIGSGIRRMNFESGFITSYINECGYELNELTARAAMLITTRSDDDTMTPYYEIYNHKNGAYLNTWIEHTDLGFNVYARKTIEKGAEIFNSYNTCNHCHGREIHFDYGTTEMLNDYGFVENYPQRWILGEFVRFDLDQKNDGSGEFILTWSPNHVKHINIHRLHFLNQQLKRLEEIVDRTEELTEEFPEITEDELRTCLQYRDALIVAIKVAIETIEAL